jgi:tetratricopeptide (TPR) repeat protein
MMKISISILVIAAMLPMAGLALAAPAVNPARGGDDGSGPRLIGTPSQQKERQAITTQVLELIDDATAAMNAGQYADAEVDARQAVSLDAGWGNGEELLAASLYAQGKTQEALQQYQTVVEHYDQQPRNELPYAQLLLQTGHWQQAVAAYNKALSSLGSGDLVRANSNFSPNVPQPTQLAAAIHIAMGLTMEGGDFHGTYQARTEQAMAHFQKALALEPANGLVNYYYGYGWQKLSPADQAKFGTTQQAKAALQKAVKVGNGNVKKAAQKALRVAMQP